MSIIRDEVRTLVPFHVEPSGGLVKLDAMENPYTLPVAVLRELGDRLAQVSLNRYPPAHPEEVKRKLADAIGLHESQALMLGNGSDELIQLVIQACAKPGASVLSPWPSFVRYAMSARLNGCAFVKVPLTGEFALDPAAMLAALEQQRPALVFISWPNNPTGNLFDRNVVEQILDAAPGLVVVDEAYHPFARDTWLPQLVDRRNLLVMRTFSKLGLAGIRLGYVCGHPDWLRELEKVRPPFNVNALTLATADLLLDKLAVFDEQAARLLVDRERLIMALRTLPGVTVFDSTANFVLVRVSALPGVFARLKERGVLVADVSAMHPMLADCIRITVGRPEENERLVATLASLTGGEVAV